MTTEKALAGTLSREQIEKIREWHVGTKAEMPAAGTWPYGERFHALCDQALAGAGMADGLGRAAKVVEDMANAQAEWEENPECKTHGAAGMLDAAAYAIRSLIPAEVAGGPECKECTGDGSACPYMGMENAPKDCLYRQLVDGAAQNAAPEEQPLAEPCAPVQIPPDAAPLALLRNLVQGLLEGGWNDKAGPEYREGWGDAVGVLLGKLDALSASGPERRSGTDRRFRGERKGKSDRRQSAPRPERKWPTSEAGDWICDVVMDIAELRTSPDDQPEMMLVTADELRAIINNNAPDLAPRPDTQPGEVVALIGKLEAALNREGTRTQEFDGPIVSLRESEVRNLLKALKAAPSGRAG